MFCAYKTVFRIPQRISPQTIKREDKLVPSFNQLQHSYVWAQNELYDYSSSLRFLKPRIDIADATIAKPSTAAPVWSVSPVSGNSVWGIVGTTGVLGVAGGVCGFSGGVWDIKKDYLKEL